MAPPFPSRRPISMLTLGWTIYRDAIRQPRFRASIAIKIVHQRGRASDGPHIFVEALNMGPIPNRLGLVFAHKSWWQRKIKRAPGAFIYPNWGHVGTSPASTRLEVGDKGSFVFPFDRNCFLKEDFTGVGISDGFGRMHWAPRKELRKVQERYRREFRATVQNKMLSAGADGAADHATAGHV